MPDAAALLPRRHRPAHVDGWFATGDLGELDADGLLTVHGRRSDLIITGGENVWPEPVEAILAAHPSVADVAVVGVPDDEWGQAVTAVVVADRCRHATDADRAPRAGQARLPGFNAPRA